jgi:hypothetical protein
VPRLTDAERRALDLRSAGTWRDIREAAEDAFDASRAYRYFDGTVTHDCADMTALARVTRAARKRDGVKWREDR